MLGPIDDQVVEENPTPTNSEAKEDLLGYILGTPLSKDFLEKAIIRAYQMDSK